jgi:serine/alanine adding enzyme
MSSPQATTRTTMNIGRATEQSDAQAWQEFVERHEECSNYHRWGWKQVIERSFGWPTFYLLAKSDKHIRGILPLVWQRSRLFGSFVTSLPFLNCGGVVAESREAKEALVAEAITIAKSKGAKYLELRQRFDPGLSLPAKTHKVAMVLSVEPNSEAMSAALPHKVRTDIRKSMKSGLDVQFGGAELLAVFYEVFAKNMRDLGTPVYGRNFFAEIFKAFPQDSYICLVRHHDKPIAVSFLSEYRGTIEALWSSSLYEFSHLKPNMFLYWSILCFAGEKGFRTFDFGRSSVGSGTYRFKKQWGSQEVPLHWVYWVPEGAALPELNNENPRYQMAIRIWQKLPVSFTKLVGPPIVKCLP